MAMFAAALPVTLVLLMMVVTAHSKSIDQTIMEAAPKISDLDTFHMSPNGEVMVLFELDILMDMKQYMELKASDRVSRKKRKAVRNEILRWKDCFVYYEFKELDFDARETEVIEGAIKEWENYTCLQFIKADSNTADKIVFIKGDGSRLGRRGGPQNISLASDCVKQKREVIHEIGHAIGWIHEHSRPDRDEFINVNLRSVERIFYPDFGKLKNIDINTFSIPYDYGSIMHYSGKAFVKDTNSYSIQTHDLAFQEVIGQGQGLSFRDIHLANVMYGCTKMKCDVDPTSCHAQFGKESFAFRIGREACACYCPGSADTEPIVKCAPSMPTNTMNNNNDRRKRSAARTSTTTVVSTTPEDPTDCEDLRPDCPQLAKDDECKMDMERMSMYCKKSCNFCDKDIDNMCMDMDPTCPLLALANYCNRTGLEVLMESKCRKSCKLCTPVDPCMMQHQMGFDAIVTSGSKRILFCVGSFVLGPVLLILTWGLK